MTFLYESASLIRGRDLLGAELLKMKTKTLGGTPRAGWPQRGAAPAPSSSSSSSSGVTRGEQPRATGRRAHPARGASQTGRDPKTRLVYFFEAAVPLRQRGVAIETGGTRREGRGEAPAAPSL